MNKLQLSLATLAAAGTLGLSTVAPASADSAASTRNIILGAAAIAGIAIEANVAQKNARANGVSGYLPDGPTVYGDGRVVDRNGNTYYPGNNGRSVSCDGNRCYVADANANGNWHADRNRDANGNWNRDANVNANQNRDRDDRNQNRDDRNRPPYAQPDRNGNENSHHDDRGNR